MDLVKKDQGIAGIKLYAAKLRCHTFINRISVEGPFKNAFEIFPLYRMPMGGSLQLIFFRSRRDPEILVKVLWNEAEASLPIPGGPYYRWSDVKAWYGPRIGEALKKIEKFPPAD